MNLTSVAEVKRYLSITTANQDALIEVLIGRESGLIEQWCGRSFGPVVNTNKRLNGNGSQILILPDSPILSVESLFILGVAIPASPDGIQVGYLYDTTALYLFGYTFPHAPQCVLASWTSGYKETETDYVPTGDTPVLRPSTGGSASQIVSIYDGTAQSYLTQVGSAPASGQYSFMGGDITFNSAQFNHPMTMVYYCIPAPVEQACIEMVGLDLQQRSNIGINSKNLANESVTYEKAGMSESAKAMLAPYRRFSIA